MAWVRIEDSVTEHRKHLKAGPAACWLWVCGIAYCQRQLSDGFIPDEAVPFLGVVTGARRLAARLVTVGLFDAAVGGFLVHDYLSFNDSRDEALLHRATVALARAEAGSRGGRATSAKRRALEAAAQVTAQVANLQQTVQQVATSVAAANLQPHPIPSHPKEREDSLLEPRPQKPATSLASDDVAQRAGDLLRHYAELYTAHRHGAKLRLIGNTLEFNEACGLVTLWDDARLEKLAIIVLTTDDEPFIVKSDRSFRIFALKASWADSRLTEWEAQHVRAN